MPRVIQVTVGDQLGVDVKQLIAAIEAGYRSVNGNAVRVRVGQGLHIDGLPQGFLAIKDAKGVLP